MTKHTSLTVMMWHVSQNGFLLSTMGIAEGKRIGCKLSAIPMPPWLGRLWCFVCAIYNSRLLHDAHGWWHRDICYHSTQSNPKINTRSWRWLLLLSKVRCTFVFGDYTRQYYWYVLYFYIRSKDYVVDTCSYERLLTIRCQTSLASITSQTSSV